MRILKRVLNIGIILFATITIFILFPQIPELNELNKIELYIKLIFVLFGIKIILLTYERYKLNKSILGNTFQLFLSAIIISGTGLLYIIYIQLSSWVCRYKPRPNICDSILPILLTGMYITLFLGWSLIKSKSKKEVILYILSIFVINVIFLIFIFWIKP